VAVVEPIAERIGARRRLRLRSPATLAPVGEFDVEGAPEVREALERSRKAQPEWAALSLGERARYLRRAVRVLLARQQEFLEVIVQETGKPETEALAAELMASCDALEFYAKNARRVLADRRVPVHLARNKRLRISYRPLGVVAIITPWNFPFLLSLNPTVQALVAGNAVLLKPSEVTPFSGRLVAELFRDAGLPEGVLQVLLGDGETGAALVEAGVDKVSFTGSVDTGRKVAEACARQLLPCTLELGGKDPMIVCADADLERAAKGAVYGAFANAGQVCISTERVYVVDEVASSGDREPAPGCRR
jgi:succinate-semialdehyde dehydrogenase/glutarate-semialdehyde dehydrogenase